MRQGLLQTGNATMRAAASITEFSPDRISRRAAKHAEDESGMTASLMRTVERLKETLEQETAGLRARAQIDLKDFNNRKTHGLLELTRAMRHLDKGGMTDAVTARLSDLRVSLEINQSVVKMHLEAVREVSTIVADAIRDAESDGTYSVSIGRTAQQRP
jgi:hypothetical protein